MKITRKQLRQLIINEIRIKPGGDMDPEHAEKLSGMIDSGDEAFITQADELAPMLGYEGDSFSQDLKRYDQVSIMGAAGEFAHYLTDDLLQKLMSVKGKDLRYGLYSRYGFGFSFEDGRRAISPDDFYEMQYRIAAKKRDIDDDDIAFHEGMDTGVEAAHDLAKAVMSLSRKTTVSMYTIGDAGIGETDDGVAIDFYEPEYEALHKAGKLVITS
jgi:hypothetical protein